jgi:cytochrome c oxidase cbb3-type subunit III
MTDESDTKIRIAQYASEKGEVVLRDHEYDGIREYDQMLPRWWLVIFYGSLLFFLGYWLAYYQFGWVKTDAQRIAAAMAVIDEAKARALEEMLAKLDDDALINEWATDTARVESGRLVYMNNCIACHGQDLHARIDVGDGKFVPLPGLSLMDGEWKYGTSPMDIFTLIHDGTPEGSPGHNGAKMEPWGNKMPPLQIAEITAFIIHENPKDFGLE